MNLRIFFFHNEIFVSIVCYEKNVYMWKGKKSWNRILNNHTEM